MTFEYSKYYTNILSFILSFDLVSVLSILYSVSIHKEIIHYNHTLVKISPSVNLGLVYTISDHFSCLIVFMNPTQKMLQSVGVYTKSYTEFTSRAYLIHTEPCKQNHNPIWN